jgi:putative DNA primase/helicase
MMAVSTIERAKGRWPEILRHLGVEDRFLRNKHGPCPNCGGKDRFRFDNKNGDGTFYCSQCGPGTGMILLRRLRGWDHKTACDEVDRIIGYDARPLKLAGANRADNAKLAAIERLLEGESDEDLVTDYLKFRGLSVTSPVLFGRRDTVLVAEP